MLLYLEQIWPKSRAKSAWIQKESVMCQDYISMIYFKSPIQSVDSLFINCFNSFCASAGPVIMVSRDNIIGMQIRDFIYVLYNIIYLNVLAHFFYFYI